MPRKPYRTYLPIILLFFLKDGFDSGLDEAETIDIPVKLIKKWTDFKKRAHARRLLLSRFD